MHNENRGAPVKLRVSLFFGARLCVLAVAACGSSSTTGSGSGDAQSLLSQTFSKGHTVKSGVLGFSLSIDPTGSSTLTTPIVAQPQRALPEPWAPAGSPPRTSRSRSAR